MSPEGAVDRPGTDGPEVTAGRVPEVLQRYLQAWNTDADQSGRQHLLNQAYARQLRYRDNRVELTGAHALAGYIATLHAHLPGARLELDGPVDQHDDGWLDYDWRLFGADGAEHSRGHDHTHLDAHGQITEIDGR